MEKLSVMLSLGMVLSTLSGCTGDYELVSYDTAVFNPPDLGVEIHTDSFLQTSASAVDVLWVVDNSCSMWEEQTALAESFSSFMAWFSSTDLDFHVGVVSTDMDDLREQGRLHEDGDTLWIDPSFSSEDALLSFAARAQMGTSGSTSERGRDAAYSAVEVHRDGANEGFYREDAALSIIAISDEEDVSELSVTDFVSWAKALKSIAGRVSFSAIVGPEGGCDTAEAGTGYLEVASELEGATASICSSDWTTVLDALGLHSAGYQREFFLTRVPVEDTLSVELRDEAGASEAVEEGEGFTYSRARNSVSFVEGPPTPGSTIEVEYQLLESAATGL